ncbi:hypothetical protein EJ06DRAFT_553056 [Trichodelitschia bisporula]|uniref:Uncharacterized protein n=1 Tax=Trichodelitschia bisporula TaxID=703511 RepID=A0A6G1I7F4_9PEZI|nr:hypothetical protein EJ06DRAFT_553056 [Trichodelitschia bisporula]
MDFFRTTRLGPGIPSDPKSSGVLDLVDTIIPRILEAMHTIDNRALLDTFLDAIDIIRSLLHYIAAFAASNSPYQILAANPESAAQWAQTAADTIALFRGLAHNTMLACVRAALPHVVMEDGNDPRAKHLGARFAATLAMPMLETMIRDLLTRLRARRCSNARRSVCVVELG